MGKELPPEAAKGPALKLQSDPRMEAYGKIAGVDRRIVENKRRARAAGAQIAIDPGLILHCEESIAFLAEELLKLGKLVESMVERSVDEPTAQA